MKRRIFEGDLRYVGCRTLRAPVVWLCLPTRHCPWATRVSSTVRSATVGYSLGGTVRQCVAVPVCSTTRTARGVGMLQRYMQCTRVL